ncbi:MAG: MBL fold metallo-hydrolase [Chloroflexi bacterium]|nr:MBL fold metallo-hydrolase [Chloroflexota bacterium]
MQITLIGHSTILIETADQRILTDPYFGTWGNPAYARLKPPAQTREALINVSLVLLSHNHWDHVDKQFFRAISNDVPIVGPSHTKWLTKMRGAKNILGIKAWESHQYGAVKITAVPALHTTITVGFVIQTEGKQIYFAGDTYYRPFMKDIGKQFQLDVALMPVTTYRLPMTMGEKEAVCAVQDLLPQVVIPIHLGIRPRLPLLRTNHTPEGFESKLRKAKLTTRVVVLKEGEAWTC